MSRASAVVLAIAVAACVRASPEWQDDVPHALITGPYVLVTGPGEAMIVFRQQQDRRASVRWTTVDGAGGEVRADGSDDQFVAELENLPLGPSIAYTVVVGDADVARGSFRAGLARGETKVRFAVFGDTRTNHQVHRAVIEAVAREQLDFFIHTGDMVERGGREDLWRTFFAIERPLLAKTAIYPAIGNHDLGNRGYYTKYFLLNRWTRGQDYYVAEWGPVRLISLDLEIVCAERCGQYEFVRDALEDGAAEGDVMVLMLHYPPYSSGAHGSNLSLRAVLAKLAKTYGAELVVTGHDHNYERTKPIDGTTYIVSGSAGAPVRPVLPEDFTAHARTEPHYVVVDVDGERVGIRAINLRGEVFDSATLPHNPPGGPPTATAPAPAP